MTPATAASFHKLILFGSCDTFTVVTGLRWGHFHPRCSYLILWFFDIKFLLGSCYLKTEKTCPTQILYLTLCSLSITTYICLTFFIKLSKFKREKKKKNQTHDITWLLKYKIKPNKWDRSFLYISKISFRWFMNLTFDIIFLALNTEYEYEWASYYQAFE